MRRMPEITAEQRAEIEKKKYNRPNPKQIDITTLEYIESE